METGGERVDRRNENGWIESLGNTGTHQGSNTGKKSRKQMKGLYYWFKTVDKLAISISIGAELPCSILEEV